MNRYLQATSVKNTRLDVMNVGWIVYSILFFDNQRFPLATWQPAYFTSAEHTKHPTAAPGDRRDRISHASFFWVASMQV